MDGSQNNRLRVFADLVSLDAWYPAFDEKFNRADLHVDATFREAVRLGGESESKVRFRLSIKEAEVIVILPAHEPVSIDKTSVARTDRKVQGTLKTSVTKQKKGNLGASVKMLCSQRPLADVSVQASGEQSMDRNETIEYSEEAVEINISHKLKEGHHAWLLKPGADKSLLAGKPWDAVAEKRLTLVDTRSATHKSIDHAVHVQIRCFGEDLIISDIELKDSDSWLSRPKMKNRIAAAEGYIRQRLFAAGLVIEPNAITEKFCEVVLAEITATPVPGGAMVNPLESHWLDKAALLISAESTNLRALARMAGGDPRVFYRGVDLSGVDLSGQDLTGMEFTALDTAENVIVDTVTRLDEIYQSYFLKFFSEKIGNRPNFWDYYTDFYKNYVGLFVNIWDSMSELAVIKHRSKQGIDMSLLILFLSSLKKFNADVFQQIIIKVTSYMPKYPLVYRNNVGVYYINRDMLCSLCIDMSREYVDGYHLYNYEEVYQCLSQLRNYKVIVYKKLSSTEIDDDGGGLLIGNEYIRLEDDIYRSFSVPIFDSDTSRWSAKK